MNAHQQWNPQPETPSADQLVWQATGPLLRPGEQLHFAASAGSDPPALARVPGALLRGGGLLGGLLGGMVEGLFGGRYLVGVSNQRIFLWPASHSDTRGYNLSGRVAQILELDEIESLSLTQGYSSELRTRVQWMRVKMLDGSKWRIGFLLEDPLVTGQAGFVAQQLPWLMQQVFAKTWRTPDGEARARQRVADCLVESQHLGSKKTPLMLVGAILLLLFGLPSAYHAMAGIPEWIAASGEVSKAEDKAKAARRALPEAAAELERREQALAELESEYDRANYRDDDPARAKLMKKLANAGERRNEARQEHSWAESAIKRADDDVREASGDVVIAQQRVIMGVPIAGLFVPFGLVLGLRWYRRKKNGG